MKNNLKNREQLTTDNSELNVGKRIRALRIEQGLSIRLLAERSGLNVNTLSFIENGKTSPSVSTLEQIAAALESPIVSFFKIESSPSRVIFQKSDQRQTVPFSHGKMEDLGTGFASNGLEPYAVNLSPHADSGSTPIVHTGLEFIYCLQGNICFVVDDVTYSLEKGDSLLFEAHLPHRWYNPQEYPSFSLLILCPSTETFNPSHVHFQ